MWGGSFKSMTEMASFANVVNIGAASKENGGKVELPDSLKLPAPPFPHDAPEIPLPSALLKKLK